MKKALDEIYEMMKSKRTQSNVEGRILAFYLNNPFVLRPRRGKKMFPIIFEAILMHINIIKAISVFRQYNWAERPIICVNRIENPFLMRLLDAPLFKLFDKICALYAKQITVNWSRVCEYNLMKSILSNRRRKSKFDGKKTTKIIRGDENISKFKLIIAAAAAAAGLQ